MIIKVDFDATGQLLTRYPAIVKCLRINGNTTRQCIKYIHRLQLGYNILIEFVIPIKLVRLIKMRLNESYSRVCIGKYLSDMFPIKNGYKQGDP